MKSTTTPLILNSDTANGSAASDVFSVRRNAARTIAMYVSGAVGALALAACGGGGAANSSGTEASVSLATISTGYTTKPTPSTALSPVTPPTTGPAQVQVGTVLTDVRIQNTGGTQTNVPFTFGQVFAAGQLAPNEGLVTKLADGSVVRLQLDVKATHADGSVRHAVISGVLPTLAANQTQKLDLAKSTASDAGTATTQSLLAAGLNSTVTITVDNVKYTASLADALASGTATKWLSGNIASEWFVNAPLKNAAGAVHPMLTARFGVRWYSGLNKQARVEVIVENDKTFAASARNYTYDVKVDVGGRTTYNKNGLNHYHHARWHQYAWWEAGQQPSINIQHNTAYLIATKAVSNYDQSITIPENILAGMANSVGAGNTGPMTIGTTVAYMGMAGGRGDIGPLPEWSVNYLLSQDKRAKDVMMANADGSGSWSMHYRDENTDYPVRTDNERNARISTHPNLASTGPLPVPRCVADHACDTPNTDDPAHEPSLVYLPYLVTGDYYYLEELQFWAAVNPLATDPGYNGVGQGLLRWHQVRGQAWSMRTLGEAAYITPDSNPMKGYFTKQLDNNLNFYSQTYVTGNPNNLGMYDGSGEGSAPISGAAPWQDDFFTWSFSYLTELGFDKARPIAQWKAKFPVGRMTADGFCYILAAHYAFPFIRDNSGKIYNNFRDLYNGNFDRDRIPTDGWELVTLTSGVMFNQLPCASQAQADYLSAINGYGWELGRMVGYSDSTIGYLSNMQPALAAAVNVGVPNAAAAWARFQARKVKPDYSKNPQWNIIPR